MAPVSITPVQIRFEQGNFDEQVSRSKKYRSADKRPAEPSKISGGFASTAWERRRRFLKLDGFDEKAADVDKIKEKEQKEQIGQKSKQSRLSVLQKIYAYFNRNKTK